MACSSANNNTFITTGGGFSAALTAPAYQQSAVAGFLAGNHSLGPGYNAGGRGYPDVALIGHLYPVIVGGEVEVGDVFRVAWVPWVPGCLRSVGAKS